MYISHTHSDLFPVNRDFPAYNLERERYTCNVCGGGGEAVVRGLARSEKKKKGNPDKGKRHVNAVIGFKLSGLECGYVAAPRHVSQKT